MGQFLEMSVVIRVLFILILVFKLKHISFHVLRAEFTTSYLVLM